MRSFRLPTLALCSLVVAAPVSADGLADLIPNLFDQRIVLAPPPPGFPSHAAHFVDQEDALRQSGELINASLVSQLSTFPLGSSAGGFTYAYDPDLGVFSRTTDSFGPIYAERAQSLGKGKWNTGFSYQQAEYDSLGDVDLDGGDIAFPLFHEDTNQDHTTTSLFFEGDVIGASSSIRAETQTTAFFVTYGVTDRFDLGVAVPVLSIDLAAESVLTLNPLSTGDRAIHRFPDGSTRRSVAASDSASGIGDVVLRGKYRLSAQPTSGFALAFDLRLPTGDEADLLGTGATQAKLFLVGSTSWGSFAPHVNLGYTVSSGGGYGESGDVPDEINYALGFDWAVHPRLTFAIDAVGRVLRDAPAIESVQTPVQFTTEMNGPIQTAQVPDLQFGEEDAHLVLGSAGLRWNVAGNLLLTLNAILSLNDDGLQDEDIVPLFGIDYSF